MVNAPQSSRPGTRRASSAGGREAGSKRRKPGSRATAQGQPPAVARIQIFDTPRLVEPWTNKISDEAAPHVLDTFGAACIHLHSRHGVRFNSSSGDKYRIIVGTRRPGSNGPLSDTQYILVGTDSEFETAMALAWSLSQAFPTKIDGDDVVNVEWAYVCEHLRPPENYSILQTFLWKSRLVPVAPEKPVPRWPEEVGKQGVIPWQRFTVGAEKVDTGESTLIRRIHQEGDDDDEPFVVAKTVVPEEGSAKGTPGDIRFSDAPNAPDETRRLRNEKGLFAHTLFLEGPPEKPSEADMRWRAWLRYYQLGNLEPARTLFNLVLPEGELSEPLFWEVALTLARAVAEMSNAHGHEDRTAFVHRDLADRNIIGHYETDEDGKTRIAFRVLDFDRAWEEGSGDGCPLGGVGTVAKNCRVIPQIDVFGCIAVLRGLVWPGFPEQDEDTSRRAKELSRRLPDDYVLRPGCTRQDAASYVCQLPVDTSDSLKKYVAENLSLDIDAFIGPQVPSDEETWEEAAERFLPRAEAFLPRPVDFLNATERAAEEAGAHAKQGDAEATPVKIPPQPSKAFTGRWDTFANTIATFKAAAYYSRFGFNVGLCEVLVPSGSLAAPGKQHVLRGDDVFIQDHTPPLLSPPAREKYELCRRRTPKELAARDVASFRANCPAVMQDVFHRFADKHGDEGFGITCEDVIESHAERLQRMLEAKYMEKEAERGIEEVALALRVQSEGIPLPDRPRTRLKAQREREKTLQKLYDLMSDGLPSSTRI